MEIDGMGLMNWKAVGWQNYDFNRVRKFELMRVVRQECCAESEEIG
jgi:hypothetical protein